MDSLLSTVGLAYKLTDNWTALGKSIVYIADNKGPGVTDQTQARIQMGAAWRQTSTDVWNALGKYEFRTESGPPGIFNPGVGLTTGGQVDRQVNIITLDVNCQPSPTWLLSGQCR